MGQGVDNVPVLGDAIGRVKSHIYADPLTVSGTLGSSLTASWMKKCNDLHFDSEAENATRDCRKAAVESFLRCFFSKKRQKLKNYRSPITIDE